MFLANLPDAVRTAVQPPISENARMVAEKRLLAKDAAGAVIEDMAGMYYRTAAYVAGDRTQNVEKYYNLMRGRRFLPNSPCLANAGTRTGQLSACFVLPVPDDLGGIFEAIKQAALIHQTGGGTGFSFSRLRPSRDRVASTQGESSGPITFMDVFNAATESIKQGGVRRGANMGILRVDHPDFRDFISHKEDLSKLTNFNISLYITDEFIDALESGTTYTLKNPRTGEPTGDPVDPWEVLNLIANRAWRTGEPGLFFGDRANAYNPNPRLGDYEATNPCGEQPLLPHESCNLGSLTLDSYVRAREDGSRFFDYAALAEDTKIATEFMDQVVDRNAYVPKVPQIAEVSLTTRKLGLGVMGEARALMLLGLDYGSEAGRDAGAAMFATIDAASKLASFELAQKYGPSPYQKANPEASHNFNQRVLRERQTKAAHLRADPNQLALKLYSKLVLEDLLLLRNSNTTTIAPTGTLSILHDTSGGCEPEFALVITRRQAGMVMYEANPIFKQCLEEFGVSAEETARVFELLGEHPELHGSLRELLAALPTDNGLTPETLSALAELAEYIVVASDVTPTDHVLMQAALQQYNDSAVSKTINMPRSATIEDVQAAYLLAIRTGCKGITVYRDGSRDFQPLSAGSGTAASQTTTSAPEPVVIEVPVGVRPRPEDLFGFTRSILTGDGKLYATLNYDDRGVRELITHVGRSGGTLHSLVEAVGRLISLALQYNVPVKEISAKLLGIRSANPYGFGPKKVFSIPDAIGKFLAEAPHQLGTTSVDKVVHVAADEDRVTVYGDSPECSDCGGRLSFEEGCVKCHSCGNSRCG